MLPVARHAQELITHAEEHMNLATEKDLKFSLIHADNSIEIMLKEFLRFRKGRTWNRIEGMNFYDLLKSCRDVPLVDDSWDYFLAYHDIRNTVYHAGTLVPSRGDVRSAIGLAKTLFNELHPKDRLPETRIGTPSKEILQHVSRSLGEKSYLNELSLVVDFSNYLSRRGYEVFPEFDVNSKYRADIVAVKGRKLIVCEAKSGKYRKMGLSALHQLRMFVELIEEKNPSKNVEGWLITDGRFTKEVIRGSEKLHVKLIDGQKLSELLG